MRGLVPVDRTGSTRRDDPADASASRLIVVAVDGRPASTAALYWAHQHLIASGDEVVVVTAYTYPSYVSDFPVSITEFDDTAGRARHDAEQSIRSVFGDDEPGGDITHIVELGTIDQVLDRIGAAPSFIIIGSRSRRRLRERLRSSTTNRITGRVTCPVISVPASTASPATPATAPVGAPASSATPDRS